MLAMNNIKKYINPYITEATDTMKKDINCSDHGRPASAHVLTTMTLA